MAGEFPGHFVFLFGTAFVIVMAGLVPAIPLSQARCPPKRDHRDSRFARPGDDNLNYFPAIPFWHASQIFPGVAGISM